MKIEKITKSEVYFVETDQKEYNNYTRYSPDNWTVRIGESDEPTSMDEELEPLFQMELSRQIEPQVSQAVSRAVPEPNIFEAGWVDTKKQLPDNDRFVIIYWNNGYHNEMNVASYDALDMRWYDHNRESFTDSVTHWREFPPKP